MFRLIKEKNKMLKILQQLKETTKPIILFGAGSCGSEVLELFNYYKISVQYFCDDDKQKQGKFLHDIEIISLEDLINIYHDYVLLITSYGPNKLIPRLKKLGIHDKLLEAEFVYFENGLDYYNYYKQNQVKLEKVYSLLADEQSKKVFVNLLQYKISRNLQLINEIDDGVENQYFPENIIKLNDKEVFVDLGAYIGDSTLDFIKRTSGKYSKIIAFEPDVKTFNKLLENTKIYNNIEYHNIGAFDKNAILSFKAENFWTSMFTEDGNAKIGVNALDNLYDERITFIKADIEGSELAALNGAENIIRKYTPKLAFCVYHKKQDIFEIPLRIHELNSSYKFYLRHHSHIAVESVLYAIPNL